MNLVRCLLPLALVTVAACGGGGGGGEETPVTQQLVFGGEDDRDGMVRSNSTVLNGGGPVTGDLDNSTNGLNSRQLFSFYIDLLPANATVTSATLLLYQDIIVGDPYGKLGSLVVDHLAYDLLGPTDYALAALTPAVGTIAADPADGYRSVDVTAAVQADRVANRVRSQYRLRFTTTSNLDGVTDLVGFADTENSISQMGGAPLLIVNYTTP